MKPNNATSIGMDYNVQALPSLKATVRPAAIFVAMPRWKRCLDIAFVICSLPFTLPAGFLIAVFVKLSSPGPALFRQERVGLNGKPFLCLKFRTMKVNADTTVHQEHLKRVITSNQPTKKLDGRDKRLIFGGSLLRAMGVDELPQLINIVRGEMSVVGPRPCIPFEFELYSPEHQRRCTAAPGLTGLWQVSGKTKTTFEEQMKLDLQYVDHKSLWLDAKIIFLTLPAIALLVWEMKVLGRTPARNAQAPSPAQEKK